MLIEHLEKTNKKIFIVSKYDTLPYYSFSKEKELFYKSNKDIEVRDSNVPMQLTSVVWQFKHF